VPVAHISEVPNVLVVHPSLNVSTLDGLVAHAKAHPGKLNYASTGIGTSSHLSSYMLASRAGFDAVHVPYKGAEALKDLLAGRIQFMFATIPSVIAHIRAGSLVALGVSSLKRSRSLPDVPTIAESGFPAFEAGSWFGIFAPRGTPASVVATLNRMSNEIIAERSVEARLVDEGADPAGGSPERFAEFVRREHEKWRKVVQDSGATVE
jgi:tripartite-type tricarboxylate transporter receptor subunit TctC